MSDVMESIRFLTKLNHMDMITELMSRTQVYRTTTFCLLCYGDKISILCKYFHRFFFWEVPCANSFTVRLLSVGLSVAGSVIIFAPLSKLKLTKASSNQLWAYHSLLFSKPEFLSFMLGARMKWNSSDENINTSILPSAFHFVVLFSFLIPLSYSLLSHFFPASFSSLLLQC